MLKSGDGLPEDAHSGASNTIDNVPFTEHDER
jgi:hypothetical protein